MNRLFARGAVVSLALIAAPACSGSSGARELPMDEPNAGGTTTTAGTSAAAGTVAEAGSGGAGGGGEASGLDAPDQEQALVAFLEAKQYAGWAREADFHMSAGPHGDAVRVYYSPRAATAVESGATTLPAGAAAVKELTSGGSLYGYSVWVKVQDATDQGNGFFWYERINQGGGNVNIYGNARGSSDCVGCHSAGKDYDLSTLPFD